MLRQPATQTPNSTLNTAGDRLFRHSKRHQWGVAALVWERDGKRGYQFSDGKLRIFKEGFYGLFESAVAPGDGSARAVRRLARLARSEELGDARRLPTLRDQIELFRREYPEGFQGELWTTKKRGAKARKALKRHRDPVLATASERLSAEAMRAMIAAEDWTALLETLVEVLASTDLVPSAQLKKLRALEPSKSLSLAIYSWLHNPSEDPSPEQADRRFNRMVRELGPAGGWQLVTAIAVLVDPSTHCCVRLRSHTLQGKMLLSEFKVSKRPQGRHYRRFCHVTKAVRTELAEAGFVPRDNIDVYDFMWETLRPAARETLLAIPMIKSAEAQAAAPSANPAQAADPPTAEVPAA